MRHPYQGFRLVVLALLLLPLMGMAAEEAPEVELPDDVDIRFVVDVSGSMKRTDPNNLRRPAVSMVAELMPEGSRGGLWTFARYVNMLVPHGEVDDRWRREVRDAVPEIGSPGQYTNIGVALDTATQDFWPERGYEDTHVVLLTDGMVDVPDGEEASQRERERILGEVVDRFKKHGATLHTMALSEEADHALLEQLAVETGGQYTVAESDEEITRAFLSAFDAASPTEEVPLKNNGFDIDESVEEFTALIFRAENAGSAKLVSPSGDDYTRDNLPDDARWHATDEYDLVTITEPESGRWQVNAIIGPDSRIKVVSKLRMAVNELPAHFYASDSLPVSVAFFEERERLTDKDFLELLDLRLEIRDEEGGRRGTRQLSSGELPSDGIFRDEIGTLGEPGRYEVRIVADGETFKRSERQTVELRPPFDTEVQARGSGADSRYRFRVMPRDPGINRDTVSVVANVTLPDGSRTERELEAVENGSAWEWVLEGDQGEGTYRVQLDISARMQSGRGIDLAMAPFEATIPRKADESNYLTLRPGESNEPRPAPEPETPSEPEPLFDPEPVTPPSGAHAPDDEEEAATPWWLWGGGILIVLLLVGGGAGYWFLRRRAGQDGEAESESPAETGADTESSRETGNEASSEKDDAESLAAAAAAYQQSQQGEAETSTETSDEAEPELEAELDPEPAAQGSENDSGQDEAGGTDEPAATEETETASDDEEPATEESIPTLDSDDASEEPPSTAETEPEPDPESDTGEPEEPEQASEDAAVGEQSDSSETDPEALADQILDENQSGESGEEDSEFALEDFDISEFDDLPEQDQSGDSNKKDDDEKDDKA